jgi:hypothetical protein
MKRISIAVLLLFTTTLYAFGQGGAMSASDGLPQAPPQELLESFTKLCSRVPANEACTTGYFSVKYRPLQFTVRGGEFLAEYGWLFEILSHEDCEATDQCEVFFELPTNNGEYRMALSYKGNLESVKISSKPSSTFLYLTLEGHTWKLNPNTGDYDDMDQYQKDQVRAKEAKKQEDQALHQSWLYKTALSLPIQYGMSQSAVEQILQRNGYHYSGAFGGAPWVCLPPEWQLNNSDILAQQGVVQDLLTACSTEYKQGNNGVQLILSFELAQRKRNPEGGLYQIITDHLTMAEFAKGGTVIKRMSEHDCKITNEENREYGNNEFCIPF